MGQPLVRALVIGSTAFLTLVDLFATQAILPALAAAYGVRPAAMGLAVNAATLGMALGPLGGGWIFDRFGGYAWLYLGSFALGLGAVAIALAFPPVRAARPLPA